MKKVAFLTLIALGSAASLVIAAPEHGHGQRGAGMERLKAADTNGDGMISRAEAQALPRLAERFDAIDANGDGQVTRDELRFAHGQAMRTRLVRHLDKDGDGKVSKAEALAAAEERFNRADANHDGFLTAEELQAAHKHGRHGKQHRS